MGTDDAYSELGLTPTASETDIKAAWRRLAARWHPDRNDSPEALRKMQRINQALEEIRRARMEDDLEEEDANASAHRTPAEEKEEEAATGQAESFDTDAEWERDREGPTSGRAQAAESFDDAEPPQVLHHALALTLEEAAFGCIKELRGEVVEDCADCAAAGFHEVMGGCRECGGEGRVRQHAWFGWLASLNECEACKGQGSAWQACVACQGSGKSSPRKYRYRVRIPAGVRHGDVLQVASRARALPDQGGETLELHIEMRPHDFFELDADGTVRCEIPVDGFAWMANRWTRVPTLLGLQQMKLDREHLVYRLKAQGFPVQRGGPRGDCIITVQPLFPEHASEEQDRLLDRLIDTNSGDPQTATGQRFAAWKQAVRAWQQSLPERENRSASN